MTQGIQPLGIAYGGSFQATLNDLMSPGRIKSTAALFRQSFPPGQPYKMGKWAPSVMNESQFGSKPLRDDWDKACGIIPSFIRAAVEAVMTENLNKADPTPMRFSILQNPHEPRHELTIKPTVDSDMVAYIGVTILCA
jgi:hypothetical protein